MDPHGAVICLDTNILVYAHRSATAEHRAARQAVERAARDGRGWGFALASIAEFWSVVTHAAAETRPSTPDEAVAFLRNLQDAGAHIWRPVASFSERLLRKAQDLEVAGVRIFDLQIALMALEAGATEIWTHDRNFTSIPGMTIHDPL